MLQLPGAIEEALPAEGDRSTMVKFKHSGHQSYTSVVRHLKNFTLDNGITNHEYALLGREFCN